MQEWNFVIRRVTETLSFTLYARTSTKDNAISNAALGRWALDA